MNLKGVFTRTRQPKMAAHLLREWWVTKANAGQGTNQAADQAADQAAAGSANPAHNGAATRELVR
jgi:hypothetical protein